MPWDFALILFALGVVVPWRGAVRMRKLLARPSLETADRLMLYVSTIVFQWLAVAVVAWRCYARGLSAQRLGVAFPQPVLTTVIAVALSLVLAANQFFGLRRLARLPAQGRSFLYEMAEKVMAQIADEVKQRWPVSRVAMVHRTGVLEIGQASVVIAVSAPHRGEAFAACQYAIDRLKQIVPIWKKEVWSDGSQWIGWEHEAHAQESVVGDH